MTRQELHDVLEGMRDLIKEWNDNATDRGHEKAEEAFWLVLYKDGKGKIGTIRTDMRMESPVREKSLQSDFDTIDEAVDYLIVRVGKQKFPFWW